MTGTYVAAMCYFYSSPGRGGRTLWRACLFVCMCVFVFLSVHRHIPRTTCPIFTQFLCMLPMAMARSPGSVAVVYLLSVYWMISYTSTSLLHGSWTPLKTALYWNEPLYPLITSAACLCAVSSSEVTGQLLKQCVSRFTVEVHSCCCNSCLHLSLPFLHFLSVPGQHCTTQTDWDQTTVHSACEE